MPMPSAAIPQAAIPSALLDTPADLASADRLTGRPTLFGELDR